MLSHFLRAVVKNSPTTIPTISYNNYYIVARTSTASTVTFTAASLGTASSNRVVAVYFSTGTSNSGQITVVTIQGISATQAVRSGTGNSFVSNAIWYATVPTGTTGDVVVTFSTTWGSTQDSYLGVVSMYDLSSTTPIIASAENTGTGVSPSLSVTLTPNANAVLFSGYRIQAVAAGSTSSWTNATEQSDVLNGTIAFSDAISSGLANSSLTVSATNTDTVVTSPRLLLASWR